MSETFDGKTRFEDFAPGLAEKLGTTIIERRKLLNICFSNNVMIPAEQTFRKVGRGLWDFGPFIAGYTPPPLEMTPRKYKRTIKDSDDRISLKPGIPVYIPGIDLSDDRTPEEVEKTIHKRFEVLDDITESIIEGVHNSFIASGSPGTGKTYTIEGMLERAADEGDIIYDKVSGYGRPTGLFRKLWEHREPNHVLLFDDCDAIYQDVIGLNILKAALDTIKKRHIAWLSEKKFETADGEEIPKRFEFEGRVVFITNVDFEREIARHNKLSPHLQALMSRCDYIDLNLRTIRELLIRIKMVVRDTEILSGSGLTKPQQNVIMEYIEENAEKMRELSLRSVVKLVRTMRHAKTAEKFKETADATVLKIHSGVSL